MMTVHTIGNVILLDEPCRLVNQHNICYVVQSAHGEAIASDFDRGAMVLVLVRINQYLEQGAKEVRLIGNEVVRTI